MLEAGNILLPAEGEGRNAVYAATQGWKAFAFDQSIAGQAKAQKLAESKNVVIDYQLSDLLSFDPQNIQFDAIALIFVHMPIEIRYAVHTKLLQYLKPGGYVILEAFTKKQLENSSGGPRSSSLLYEYNQIADDFKELEFIEFSETTTHLEEGPLHQGDAHVIRFFARKPLTTPEQ